MRVGLGLSFLVFKNRVQRRIVVTERDDMTGSWRKLLTEEPRNVHSSPNTCTIKVSKVKLSRNRPWRPIGL
jgi:hypothetical protein